MSILDTLMGNAEEVSVEDLGEEITSMLVPGEQIEHAFRLVRDMFIFTNKRLVQIDKQGISGKKIEYHSVPYRAITHFSVETAGSFDRDSELKVWLSGRGTSISMELKKGMDIVGIQRTLAQYVLE